MDSRNKSPLLYRLTWQYYYFFPSMKKNAPVDQMPIEKRFSDEESAVKIVFFGDLICLKSEKVPIVHPTLKNLFSSADLVAGNLESPVVRDHRDKTASYLSLNHHMSEQFLTGTLSNLGIEPSKCVLNIANNHTADKDTDGCEKTKKYLTKLGIMYSGSTQIPLVKTVHKDMKIGFTSWATWINKYTINNGIRLWQDVQNEMFDTRSCEITIAMPHWDYEFRHYPSKDTRTLAKRVAAKGFNLIVGSHPHVIQPIEMLDKTLCAYSLGNFTGPSLPALSWPQRLIGVLEVHFSNRGNLVYYKLHPFVQIIEDYKVYLAPITESDKCVQDKTKKRLKKLFPDKH